MKKIIMVCMFVVSAFVCADEVHLVTNSAETESWYAYSETFTKVKDGYSVMLVHRFNKANKNDVRSWAGMSFTDCSRGYGSLYTKDSEKDNWEFTSNVSIETAKTVADIIAANICNAGEKMNKTVKSVPNKQSKNI